MNIELLLLNHILELLRILHISNAEIVYPIEELIPHIQIIPKPLCKCSLSHPSMAMQIDHFKMMLHKQVLQALKELHVP